MTEEQREQNTTVGTKTEEAADAPEAVVINNAKKGKETKTTATKATQTLEVEDTTKVAVTNTKEGTPHLYNAT